MDIKNIINGLTVDKMIKLSAIIGIILVSLSVFYYFVLFLPKLERDKIEQQKQVELLNSRKEQEKLNQAKKDEQSRQALLDSCLSDAQSQYLTMGNIIKKRVEACKTAGGGYCNLGSMQAFIDAYDKNDAQLQQDKDNCFKQYK